MKFAVVVFPGSNCEHDTRHVLAGRRGPGARLRLVRHRRRRPRRLRLPWSCPAASPTATTCAAGAIARFAPVMDAVRALRRRRRPRPRHLQRVPGAARGGPAARGACCATVARVPLPVGDLRVETPDTPFTAGVPPGQVLRCRSPTGRATTSPTPRRWRARGQGQVVLRYCDAAAQLTAAANPNGSQRRHRRACATARATSSA